MPAAPRLRPYCLSSRTTALDKVPRWEKIASFLMPGAGIPFLGPCEGEGVAEFSRPLRGHFPLRKTHGVILRSCVCCGEEFLVVRREILSTQWLVVVVFPSAVCGKAPLLRTVCSGGQLELSHVVGLF